MAIDRASFILRFPEFTRADSSMVDQTIADVDATTSDVWDSTLEREAVIMLTVADTLARQPMGRDAQLTNKDGSTAYSARLQKLLSGHACLHPAKLGQE